MWAKLRSVLGGGSRDDTKPGQADAQALRVLVVDDDPLVRELLKVQLTARGYRVLTAANGREGVALAHKELPNAIIMDGNMPELDGLEALKQIRRDRRTADTPVVMLTARMREGDVLTGFRHGAQEYLTKPVTVEEVVNSLKLLLKS